MDRGKGKCNIGIRNRGYNEELVNFIPGNS
jgi:hypothetical protein